jgi:hypothetical protein
MPLANNICLESVAIAALTPRNTQCFSKTRCDVDLLVSPMRVENEQEKEKWECKAQKRQKASTKCGSSKEEIKGRIKKFIKTLQKAANPRQETPPQHGIMS